jgi:hypothetical protein
MKANEKILRQLDLQYIRKTLLPKLLAGKPKGEPIDSTVCWPWPHAKANGRAIQGTTHGNLYVARTLYKLLAPKLGLPLLTEANLKNTCDGIACTNPRHYEPSAKSVREAKRAAELVSEL